MRNQWTLEVQAAETLMPPFVGWQAFSRMVRNNTDGGVIDICGSTLSILDNRFKKLTKSLVSDIPMTKDPQMAGQQVVAALACVTSAKVTIRRVADVVECTIHALVEAASMIEREALEPSAEAQQRAGAHHPYIMLAADVGRLRRGLRAVGDKDARQAMADRLEDLKRSIVGATKSLQASLTAHRQVWPDLEKKASANLDWLVWERRDAIREFKGYAPDEAPEWPAKPRTPRTTEEHAA